jgi:molybdenum cofactor cytidylyltransferase
MDSVDSRRLGRMVGGGRMSCTGSVEDDGGGTGFIGPLGLDGGTGVLDEERRASTAAVVLAAGSGSRFAGGKLGGHKLLAPWRGRPIVAWAVENALRAHLARTYVVTGAVDLHEVLPGDVEVLLNTRWVDGQATSLQVAIRAAREAGFAAVVVGLGDQPLIAPEAWRLVAGARTPIAVARYAGVPRNPVRLAREIWDELPENGDEGARVLIRRRLDLVSYVDCVGDPVDVDTVEDLHRLS